MIIKESVRIFQGTAADVERQVNKWLNDDSNERYYRVECLYSENSGCMVYHLEVEEYEE